LESGEVAVVGAVEVVAVPSGGDKDEVESRGAGGVIEAGLGQAAVAGAA
jgi:hypothetical protein